MKSASRSRTSREEPTPAIAVDAKNVYWTDWGTDAVMMVPVTGGVATTLALGSCAAVDAGQCNAYGLAADATRVYWTNEALGGGTVMWVAKP